MKTEEKLFKSGEVILTKKTYGKINAFYISIGISVVLATITNGFIVKLDTDGWLMLIIFFALVLFIIYNGFIQQKIFPQSTDGYRYDSIVLFDDYLIGRIHISKIEDKIEFSNIKHIVKEESNEIRITFIGLISGHDNMNTELIINPTQGYEFSRKLSRIQKRALVNYLNERIKEKSKIID
jgi:hypothetical protein